MSLKIHIYLEPKDITLFGNRVFPKEKIYMRINLIRVGPKSKENVFIRDRKGYIETEEKVM